MTKTAPKQPIVLRMEQESSASTQKKPYERLKNEPAVWYQRFKRYMLMGAQRSVGAVLEQERQAQESTQGERKKNEELQSLTLAPDAKEHRAKLSSIAVPRNWKAASVKCGSE